MVCGNIVQDVLQGRAIAAGGGTAHQQQPGRFPLWPALSQLPQGGIGGIIVQQFQLGLCQAAAKLVVHAVCQLLL